MRKISQIGEKNNKQSTYLGVREHTFLSYLIISIKIYIQASFLSILEHKTTYKSSTDLKVIDNRVTFFCS